jgi:small GTP-binding protein
MWRVPRGILNLGILAHVDAGKTTLTERLLYSAGVIDELGSVDSGTTQTDSLALERQRGITIKSAVVSFTVDDTTVNLIDTPGHPDFVAEVERALSMLDGVVLVVSAVEGVQPQTRILWRTLQRLRVPTLFFVNKIDRRGAGCERLLGDIAVRLTPALVPMGSVRGLGTREATFILSSGSWLAEVLAEHDDAVLTAYLDDNVAMPSDWLDGKLAGQVRETLVHPVYFGSAITGAGVDTLLHDLVRLLPPADGDAEGPVSARVFKVERGVAGDKIAYARMFSGTIAVRDRVRFGSGLGLGHEGKVTAIHVFTDGTSVRRDRVTAGQIARLSGLAEIQIGDVIGVALSSGEQHYFAPPTLETAIVAVDPGDKPRLYAALTELAEQDPLINVRQDDIRQEIYVSLYGEVQKQVIEATLLTEYGLETRFRETTPICVERPVGSGGRGGRDPARAGESVSRHAWNPYRPGSGRHGHRVPARGKPRGRSDIYLQEHGELRRRDGAVHRRYAAPGPVWLAGHRLHRVADPLPVQRPRRASFDARPAQRTPGLPQAHPGGGHGSAETGGHDGLRAGPPVPPRHTGRHAQRPTAGTGEAACGARGFGDEGLLVHPGRRHPGDQGARAATADPAPHQGRRRHGIILRPLRAGSRSGPDPAADR